MRLFAALVPPEDVRRDVARLVDGARGDWPALRWARPDQWHLTLTFYGEVDERTRADLETRLARAAARASPLSLSFGAGGQFGGRRRARVVWLRVDGDRDPLRRLARAATAAGRRAGLRLDDRPYRPHLTLARARQPQDVDALLDRLDGHAGPPWTADTLHLVRSHLGAAADRGSVYETVASWSLGGTSAEPPGGTAAGPRPGE